MIICHCNTISRDEILKIAKSLVEKDPDTPIRSNLIYRGRNCRAKCGCCRPNIEAILLAEGYKVTITQQEEIDRLRERHMIETSARQP